MLPPEQRAHQELSNEWSCCDNVVTFERHLQFKELKLKLERNGERVGVIFFLMFLSGLGDDRY
jgi:hypothetical protein